MTRLPRFWQLFLRQLLLLVLVSGAIVAFFFFAHAFPEQPASAWMRFAAIDVVALAGGSAATAWVKLNAERERAKR